MARRDGVVDIVHGVEVADPYHWLGQGKPTSRQADETADVHAFLRWQLRM